MAKKVVGKVKSSAKQKMAKVIISFKRPKTGAYAFKETIVRAEEVSALVAKTSN